MTEASRVQTLLNAQNAEIDFLKNRVELLEYENKDWHRINNRYADRIEKLETQLPEGMEHCTIRFIKCEVGHGRLTANNWIDTGCPHCKNEKLERVLWDITMSARLVGDYLHVKMAREALQGKTFDMQDMK